ncbi:hypothetical protein [Bacillus alkalicellulosilyticus]|uniref:hypothetical protein n=1 Tax=Alkalihalobacterium alkalicellulosilyticum TaxID=1912214 RepID=UPI00099612A8|nr:hypothetical protein [Bacillus alkalicellulosilyticus]
MDTLAIFFRKINFINIKLEIILIFFFFLTLIFLCSNPFVINPMEFILYTKYFIPIGLPIVLLVSYQIHAKFIKSIPYELLKINQILKSQIEVLVKIQCLHLIFFLIMQGLVSITIAMVITLIFDSGLNFFVYLIKIYFVYYAIPFTFAWLLGSSISIIKHIYSVKKTIIFLLILIPWIPLILLLEYKSKIGIFIHNRNPYIDLYTMSFLDKQLTINLLYIICLLVVLLFILIKTKVPFLQYTFIVVIIFTLLSSTVWLKNKHNLVEDLFFVNDTVLYEQLKNKEQEEKDIFSDWTITEIEFNANAISQIKIKITLNEHALQTRFYVNEQFSISHIISVKGPLPFSQNGNAVDVMTEGVDSFDVYYKNTNGTSFFSITPNLIFLPTESLWLPSTKEVNIYNIDSFGNLYTNVKTRECSNIKYVVGKQKYSLQGDNLDCLSIIKGPFKSLTVDGTGLLIYKPFLTRNKNYSELIEKIQVIQEEVCLLQNLNSENFICNRKNIEKIVIVPKSLNTPALSMYDSTYSNNQYTFYVSPFIDINEKPITSHLEELATFLIPFRHFEDKEISILTSIYLMEKMDIQTMGYIDWIIQDSDVNSEEWMKFKILTIEEKQFYIQKGIENKKLR